jgi:hypothetical protein
VIEFSCSDLLETVDVDESERELALRPLGALDFARDDGYGRTSVAMLP